MEHSVDKKKELYLAIGFAEKQIRKERKAGKLIEPKLRSAISHAKQLETYWNQHQIAAREWLKQRDKLLGEYALLTKNPDVIHAEPQQTTGN